MDLKHKYLLKEVFGRNLPPFKQMELNNRHVFDLPRWAPKHTSTSQMISIRWIESNRAPFPRRHIQYVEVYPDDSASDEAQAMGAMKLHKVLRPGYVKFMYYGGDSVKIPASFKDIPPVLTKDMIEYKLSHRPSPALKRTLDLLEIK